MASDEHFMGLALREAQKAYRADEVPVGAVVVHEGHVIARSSIDAVIAAIAVNDVISTKAENIIGDASSNQVVGGIVSIDIAW